MIYPSILNKSLYYSILYMKSPLRIYIRGRKVQTSFVSESLSRIETLSRVLTLYPFIFNKQAYCSILYMIPRLRIYIGDKRVMSVAVSELLDYTETDKYTYKPKDIKVRMEWRDRTGSLCLHIKHRLHINLK